MSQLQEVRKVAREQAKENDEFAVCCTDGDFEYARTENEAVTVFKDMHSMRQSLTPDGKYEYDIVALDAAPDEQPDISTNSIIEGSRMVENRDE